MQIIIQNFILLTVFFLGLSGCNPHVKVDKQNAPPKWEKIGPGGGGSTFIPTFSYESPDVFLVRCDMTGSYLTKDGGASYQQINLPNGASAYAFDPNDANELADSIKMILDDEKTKLEIIENGQKIIKNYSWRTMAQETYKIYQGIVK